MTGKQKVVYCAAMALRIAIAAALAHYAYGYLEWSLPIIAEELFGYVVKAVIGVAIFFALKAKYWRLWVAFAIGMLVWHFARGIKVYTDPVYDAACGHNRYFGLPLPDHMANECSSGFSVLFDGKPGRTIINMCFWFLLAYALVVSPRIVRWLKSSWSVHRRRFISAGALLVAVLALICIFRTEIANWYVPHDWQSPHGNERIREDLRPKRSCWQHVMSYF